MLKKINRIKSNRDFGVVKADGKIISTPLFSLVFVESEFNRFGMVVSKKISNKAVERNRVRRLLSLAIGAQMKLVVKPIDGVFLVKKTILGKSKIEIEMEVKRTIEELNLR